MKAIHTILYCLSFLFVAGLFAGCEDMEDTYKDYAGDGPIRYVGKCKDVQVLPGWNCLRLSWMPSDDPTVEQIKITCGDIVEFIPATQTEYTITGLGNESYKVTISGVDAEGNESIATELYERPYTAEHEQVLSMTRVVGKWFVMKDRVAMIFSTWNEGLTDCHIEYTAADGSAGTYNVMSFMAQYQKRLVITGVDTSKPVTLKRTGKLEGCPDDIPFPDVVFTNHPMFNSDFKALLCEHYNLEDVTTDWMESVTELEIDRKVTSLEDIMYFPNLKKLVLGKNLFIKPENKYPLMSNFKIQDETYSTEGPVDWPLRQMNEVTGLTVDNYGELLISSWESFVNNISEVQSVPALGYIEIDPATQVAYSNAEAEGTYDSHYEYLFDNDPTTAWESMNNTMIQSYTFTIDLQSVRAVAGTVVTQKDVSLSSTDRNYLPSIIELELSADGEQWTGATIIEQNTLGNTPGESTLINFLPGSQARYVRFTVSDISANNEVRCKLGDFNLFE